MTKNKDFITDFPGLILLNDCVQPQQDGAVYMNDLRRLIRVDAQPKIHTLRIDKLNRWKPGVLIHFATGVRTPDVKVFGLAECVSTQRVKLWSDGVQVFISVDGRQLSGQEVVLFYRNDGFKELDSFLDWFMPTCLDAQAEGADGVYYKVIHWTNFRY